MRYLKESSAVVSLLLASFIWLTMASAAFAGNSAADRLVRVPVFFITDRNLQLTKTGETDFGPQRKYIGECKHDPFMGSAYCVVENVDGKPLSDHLKDLGWAQAERRDKVGEFKATPITGDSFDKIQQEFFGKVHEKALLTDDKNIFLFAHGYKNAFHNGLSTAAKLAYNAERPLILYSWPSAAKLRSYSTDENNVEWSQEHFNDVVKQLEDLCTKDPSVKVRLFAHSMGTRLVVRATPLLREKSYAIEAALICPDIDDGLVQHYARRYLSVKGTMTIRLYMSRRDKALAFSQLLHGGYTRLGEQADALGDWVTQTISGQKPPGDDKPTKEQEAEYAERLSKTQRRMQTIDFTAIDKGLVGHNVPAKLVCSMSFTGTPGPGLELVDEESGQRSKLSRTFTKWAKLKGKDPSMPTGAVLRVVKDDSSKHDLAKGTPQPAH